MPVIRISDETMRRLSLWAEPLRDTADLAFRKVLDAAESNPNVAPSRTDSATKSLKSHPADEPRESGGKLPQKEFRWPLLRAVYDMGGSARTGDLRRIMKKRMAAVLSPDDLETLSSGTERWWDAVCLERLSLVRDGYLRDDSRRGAWDLSEKGTELVEEVLGESSEPFIEHLLAVPAVGDDADFDRDSSQPRTVKL